MNAEMGCMMPIEDWLWLNRSGIFENPALRKFVAPFPPAELIRNVAGSDQEINFAHVGTDFYVALANASPKPLTDYRRLLDFGCGCGRLLRMLKGHPHEVSGCDIDPQYVQWVEQNLPYVQVARSTVKPPLPYANHQFDCIIGISVFSHLNEKSQNQFLRELFRVSMPGAVLMLSIHGARALARAKQEEKIRAMISVDEELFQAAQKQFAEGRHAFILQRGHLTYGLREQVREWITRNLLRRPVKENRYRVVHTPFQYGISFIPESYVRSHWSRWFEILDYRSGAIHDFQDIVVLQPKKR